jgi:hypothetical protein
VRSARERCASSTRPTSGSPGLQTSTPVLLGSTQVARSVEEDGVHDDPPPRAATITPPATAARARTTTAAIRLRKTSVTSCKRSARAQRAEATCDDHRVDGAERVGTETLIRPRTSSDPQPVETVRATVPAGDYAIQNPDGTILAAVERKSLDNLATTLSDGTLAFQLQRLAELPLAAVAIETRYSALHKLEHVDRNWLADQLARLEVRYPEVHLVFADSRRYAEDWTYRFLTTALTDTTDPNRNGD